MSSFWKIEMYAHKILVNALTPTNCSKQLLMEQLNQNWGQGINCRKGKKAPLIPKYMASEVGAVLLKGLSTTKQFTVRYIHLSFIIGLFFFYSCLAST